MALLVVLVPADRGDVPLGSATVEALARLGVSSVSVARDEHTTAVVLEGWAFDPARPDAALHALGTADGARALRSVGANGGLYCRKGRRTHTMKRISLLLATAALTVAALGGAASADPGPTPNGLTGALNMTNTNALAGMLNAMSTNNAHGDAGMFCAVFITNGFTAPGDCR